MAPITRSKDELARIVALLESDSYINAEALAYAVLKEAAEIVASRHLWAVRPAGHPVWWGPYWTLAQAEKAWETEIGPVIGAEGVGEVARVAPWPDDPTPPTRKGHPREVCTCGHPRWHHTTEGKRLYCGPKKAGCTCTGGFQERGNQ